MELSHPLILNVFLIFSSMAFAITVFCLIYKKYQETKVRKKIEKNKEDIIITVANKCTN